jgi:hypothetical protein
MCVYWFFVYFYIHHTSFLFFFEYFWFSSVLFWRIIKLILTLFTAVWKRDVYCSVKERCLYLASTKRIEIRNSISSEILINKKVLRKLVEKVMNRKHSTELHITFITICFTLFPDLRPSPNLPTLRCLNPSFSPSAGYFNPPPFRCPPLSTRFPACPSLHALPGHLRSLVVIVPRV